MEKSSPSNVQYGCAFFGIYIRLQLRSQVDIHLLIWKKTTTTTKQSWWTLFMSTPHKAFIYLYINVLQWQNTNYKCIFNIVSALPEMNWSEDNRPSPSLVSILVNKFCVFASTQNTNCLFSEGWICRERPHVGFPEHQAYTSLGEIPSTPFFSSDVTDAVPVCNILNIFSSGRSSWCSDLVYSSMKDFLPIFPSTHLSLYPTLLIIYSVPLLFTLISDIYVLLFCKSACVIVWISHNASSHSREVTSAAAAAAATIHCSLLGAVSSIHYMLLWKYSCSGSVTAGFVFG